MVDQEDYCIKMICDICSRDIKVTRFGLLPGYGISVGCFLCHHSVLLQLPSKWNKRSICRVYRFTVEIEII